MKAYIDRKLNEANPSITLEAETTEEAYLLSKWEYKNIKIVTASNSPPSSGYLVLKATEKEEKPLEKGIARFTVGVLNTPNGRFTGKLIYSGTYVNVLRYIENNGKWAMINEDEWIPAAAIEMIV